MRRRLLRPKLETIVKNAESNPLVREYIVTALVDMMKTRDWQAISVTDISKKAGVSRMTYYRNYSSKEDILNKYMEKIGDDIYRKIQSRPELRHGTHDYYLFMFEQLGRYSDMACAVYRAELGDLILRNINNYMLKTFSDAAKEPANKYLILFFAGAFYNVFINWVMNNMRESCEEMAKICCDLISENGFALKQIQK